VLELRELVKHYQVGDGAPIHAVDGVSMRIGRGEFVALYGPSGSGKTTLLELIAGLQAPDSGSVLVEGRDVAAMSRKEGDEYRLRDLGIIGHDMSPGWQASQSASLKLMLSNVRSAPRKIEPLLGQLGLGERLHHRTEQLSMGERQRVLIALALSTEPKLVLADEPTGNLDTQRTREILGLLSDLCHDDSRDRKLALLLATHDQQVAMFADRVYELRDGRLQAYTPDQDSVTAVPSQSGA
jgi:ABC-type lipoprotein export system ATPase subunit